VLALAASGGLALVTAAGPAAAVAPQTPTSSDGYSLSIAASDTSIHPGDSDVISGVLTKSGVPQSGDTVYLRASTYRARHHHAHRVGSATTGADGSVHFTVTPKATTRYRLVFRATPATPGARSNAITVHVLRASSLTIGARATRNGEVVRGALRSGGHGLVGRKVMLQERAVGSDTWTAVATHRTRRHGVVVFRVAAPSVPEEFQLVFAGGRNVDGCQSGVVTAGG
jgi:hypothetical protein